MMFAQGPFRHARLPALVACLLLPLASAAGAPRPLAVAPAQVDPALAPVALGFDRWLETSLRSAGREVIALPAAGTAALGAAAQRGAAQALLPRLREESGRVELRLSVYEAATGDLIASSRAEAALDSLGGACSEALAALGRSIGLSADTAPPAVSELASATRSLELASQGHLFGAWRAVQGKLTPVAMRERETIVARARKAGDSESERARVLSASGDPVAAWALVGGDAQRALAGGSPDASLLLAAAEIQLSLGHADVAQRYLTAVQPHASNSVDVQIAVARSRLAQGDRAGARAAARRAAELAADDPLPAELLIEIDADQPAQLAADWLDAGTRAARRLDPELARRQWQRAAELDAKLAPTTA
ncbi:MAG TPA: hypothetical protein VKH41_09305, partial [Myxococcota bacterium]|nr:hypothetical protein [Myxococcota bacterium]